MPDNDLVKTLQQFGMTEREGKLYLAMLEKPEITAAELHRISGVMRTKTYETLEQMVSKGFCLERVENKRRYFRAIRPKELKEMFQRHWEAEQAWRLQAAESVFSTLDEKFENRQGVDRSLDFIEVIRSKDQIHQCYLDHLKGSEEQILTFNRSPYACLDADVLKEQEEVNLQRLDRGVVSRSVSMAEPQYWSWLEPHLKGIKTQGEQIRVVPHLPMKMFVFDGKRVMLALPSVPGMTGADFTMLVVEDRGFTESCTLLFEMFWNQGVKLEEWGK